MSGPSPLPTGPRSTSSGGAVSPTAHLSRREFQTLFLTTLGSMMVAIDSTIVILALPTMTRELHAPLGTVIWTILAYLLVTAALTTQAGRLGDLLGRGMVYNSGFAVFTIGSAFCGFAPTATFLIGSRVVQAIGGAVMFANAAALIATVFPPQRRGRAFGMMTLGWSMGAVLGILLGGLITTLLGWRYIFFINIPIGILAVGWGLRTLPKTERQRVRFDVPGFLSLSIALSFICYGAIEIASYGLSTTYLAYVGIGLALVPVFAVIELWSTAPMLDIRLLRQRLLGFSLIAGFLQGLGYLSVIFLLTMYLQGLRGLSPLNASLLLVPGYLVGGLLGPWMGRHVDRIGPRIIATGGLTCLTVAVLAYSTLTIHSWLGLVPAISLVAGIGTGMFFPANNTAIMSQAPQGAYGSIAGLRSTLTNMGTLMSFVITITIASAAVPRYVAYEVFLGTTNLTGGIGDQFLNGIHVALYGCAVILIVAAACSWSRGPHTSGQPARSETPVVPDPPAGGSSGPGAGATRPGR